MDPDRQAGMSRDRRLAIIGSLAAALALVPVVGVGFVVATPDVSPIFWPLAGAWIAGLLIGGVSVVVLAARGQVFPGPRNVRLGRERMDRVRNVGLVIGTALAFLPVHLLGIPDFRPFLIAAIAGFVLPLTLVAVYQIYRGIGTD